MNFILRQLLGARRKIVQIGQTELRKPNIGFLRLPEGVRRQNKADFATVWLKSKTFAHCIVFPFPKKHGLLFGVPESRKTLRGEEQQSESIDICNANTI